jgi:molybdopterin-guanine dinucleotide biosynthesis protein A
LFIDKPNTLLAGGKSSRMEKPKGLLDTGGAIACWPPPAFG